MAACRDFGVMHIEELTEILSINNLAKRKWADREGGQKKFLIKSLYVTQCSLCIA